MSATPPPCGVELKNAILVLFSFTIVAYCIIAAQVASPQSARWSSSVAMFALNAESPITTPRKPT